MVVDWGWCSKWRAAVQCTRPEANDSPMPHLPNVTWPNAPNFVRQQHPQKECIIHLINWKWEHFRCDPSYCWFFDEHFEIKKMRLFGSPWTDFDRLEIKICKSEYCIAGHHQNSYHWQRLAIWLSTFRLMVEGLCWINQLYVRVVWLWIFVSARNWLERREFKIGTHASTMRTQAPVLHSISHIPCNKNTRQ